MVAGILNKILTQNLTQIFLKNCDNKKSEINILISLSKIPQHIVSLVAHPGLEPGTPRLKGL